MCHKIQDLINDGDIVVDWHNNNLDHKAFKEPFQSYEKGEISKEKPNNKVNYTYYDNDDEIVHMVEPMGLSTVMSLPLRENKITLNLRHHSS